MLERTLLARPLRVEERQLSAARVGTDEREVLLLRDHVHPEVAACEIDDRLPVRDPERDVIEGQRLHGGTIPTGIRATSRTPDTDQGFRLLDRVLVERFFAPVFLPPREADDLDGARLIPPAAFRAAVDVFFAAEVVFFFADDPVFFADDPVFFAADPVFFAADVVFFFAPDAVFFAADVVFLRALLADFERVLLDERFAAVFFPPRDAALLDAARLALDFFAALTSSPRSTSSSTQSWTPSSSR